MSEKLNLESEDKNLENQNNLELSKNSVNLPDERLEQLTDVWKKYLETTRNNLEWSRSSERLQNQMLQELTNVWKKHLEKQDEEMSNKSRMTRKDWLQIIIMPFAFIFLTAIIGGIFATWFQDRSFQKNTLFQAQYERLLTSQKETSAQYQDLSGLLDTLESYEKYAQDNNTACSANNFKSLIERLKQFENRRLGLKDYSKEADDHSALDDALNNYSQKLGESIKCESTFVLEGCKNDCKIQSIELRDALQKSIYAHNDLINNLINKNK